MYLFVLEVRGKIKEAIQFLEKDSAQVNAVPGTKIYHVLERLYFAIKDYNSVIERSKLHIETELVF